MHTPDAINLPNREFTLPIKSIEGHFDLAKYMSEINGIAVEVGGPTVREDNSGFAAYPVLQGVEPTKGLFILNNSTLGNDDVDILASAKDLPFEDESIGILLASYLPAFEFVGTDVSKPINLHEKFILEAQRCLKANGMLVMNGVDNDEIKYAEQHGLSLVKQIEERDDQGRALSVLLSSAAFIKN